MYYTIYTSDENEQFYIYQNKINKNTTKNIQENLCIICWSKNEINDELFYIKNLDKYIVTCNCNVLMHVDCLDIWIQKTNSCPICRKNITYNENHLKIITYYIIGYNYIIKLLRFATILSILNFICLLICNTYFQYTLTYELFKNHFFYKL